MAIVGLLIAVAVKAELTAVAPDLAGTDCPEHELLPLPWPGVYGCITGVGPVNAALAMGRVLGQGQITAVLNTGLAGSFNLEAAPLGTMVMASEECWPEYGFWGKNGFCARELGFCQWTALGGIYDRLPLTDALSIIGLKLPPESVPRRGVSLTVAGVSGTSERARELERRYGALVENMEGFAVAYACARQGLPFVEIRAISNLVGSREPEHRDFPGALAALSCFFQRAISV